MKPPIHEVQVGSKLIVVVVSMNRCHPPIENSFSHQVTWKKKPIVQTIIVFVGERNYEWPHIDDGILDFEGWHPIKQIVTKHSSWNIITTLHGTNTLQKKEKCNNDDDDNDIEIFYEAIEAPNYSDYNEPQPQHLKSIINHPFRSRITRAS
jgi:hypothetical protein